jgi:lipoate-protein ligase A
VRATGGSTAEVTLRMAVAGTGRLSRLLQLSHSTARVLVSPSTDAATNLALEDWLFHGPSGTSKPSDGGPVLYLYRNAPSIVLGRNQNPWKQCRMAGLRSQGVQLVRRNSGGGTVYHDLGNSCFSFIGTQGDLGDQRGRLHHAQFVASALRSAFGTPVAVTPERMELVVADDVVDDDTLAGHHHRVGAKFSGAAFRVSGQRAYYHGTLLLRSDLAKLEHLLYIEPPPPDAPVVISGRDTASVRAARGVVNLSDLASALPRGEDGGGGESGGVQAVASHARRARG